MTDTALYYAFSTIAQCAAALAAIIGAFGLWRLSHLRELDHEDAGQERQIKSELVRARVQREYEQEKEAMGAVATEVEQSPPSTAALHERGLELRLTSIDVHRHFIMAEWRWLTKLLAAFLLETLVILVLAIGGLAFVNTLHAWVWTMRAGIILASFGLAIGPAVVVWNAARRSRPGTILAALLIVSMASPALAGPVRCQTYPEPTMGRLQTLCDDGSRATSRWNTVLDRWDTTVTPSPGQPCTPHQTSRGQEVRCR
jgi:hypothetical protein